MSEVLVPNFVRNGMLGAEGQTTINSSSPNAVYQIPPRIGILAIQAVVSGTATYQVYTTLDPNVNMADLNASDWFPVFGTNQTTSQQRPLYGALSHIWFRLISGSGSVKASIRGQ